MQRKKLNKEIDYKLYGFGSNGSSQLNISSNDLFTSPAITKIPNLSILGDSKIIKVVTGYSHTLILCENNKLYGWGNCDEYQLGGANIAGADKASEVSDDIENLVRRIPFRCKIKDIAAGQAYSAILTVRGRVFIAGTFKHNGVFGFSETERYGIKFREDDILRSIVKITGKHNHLLCLDRKGTVYGLGINDCHQLGYKTRERKPKECLSARIVIKSNKKTLGNSTSKIIDISTGELSSYALTNEGKIISWGGNFCGQLGIGNKEEVNALDRFYPSFTEDEDEDEVRIKKISSGKNHVLFLSEKGDLYTCGNNEYGQCGIENDKSKTVKYFIEGERFIEKVETFIKKPKMVKSSVSDISTGCNFSIIKSENILYGAGFNLGGIISTSKDKNIYNFIKIENQSTEVKSIDSNGLSTFLIYK